MATTIEDRNAPVMSAVASKAGIHDVSLLRERSDEHHNQQEKKDSQGPETPSWPSDAMYRCPDSSCFLHRSDAKLLLQSVRLPETSAREHEHGSQGNHVVKRVRPARELKREILADCGGPRRLVCRPRPGKR